jgi:hypothetical protein
MYTQKCQLHCGLLYENPKLYKFFDGTVCRQQHHWCHFLGGCIFAYCCSSVPPPQRCFIWSTFPLIKLWIAANHQPRCLSFTAAQLRDRELSFRDNENGKFMSDVIAARTFSKINRLLISTNHSHDTRMSKQYLIPVSRASLGDLRVSVRGLKLLNLRLCWIC